MILGRLVKSIGQGNETGNVAVLLRVCGLMILSLVQESAWPTMITGRIFVA